MTAEINNFVHPMNVSAGKSPLRSVSVRMRQRASVSKTTIKSVFTNVSERFETIQAGFQALVETGFKSNEHFSFPHETSWS